MVSSIAWTDHHAPSDDGPPVYPIYSPVPRMEMRFIVLSAHLLGVWTHWLDRRTIPHVQPTSACRGCRTLTPRRWKGYLAVWEPNTSRTGLLEITRDAVRHAPDVFRPHEPPDLRGRWVRAYRIGLAANAPMRVEIDFGGDPETDIPEAIDVYAALLRVWGLTADRAE